MVKKYSLTKNHKKEIREWVKRWIANAMSTRPIEEDEKPIIREHVKNLYKSSKLSPPPDYRIVFVPSPFIGKFVAGFASGVWYLRNNKKSNIDAATLAATDAAAYKAILNTTFIAILAATNDATDDATDEATLTAINAAINAATDEATDEATLAATRAATDAATLDATLKSDKNWFDFKIKTMVDLATKLGNKNFFLNCVVKASKFYQGGNFWAGWSAFISFFRYIAKLPIDYKKWDDWEKLSELSSLRYVHEKFCIICDRPKTLKIDDRNRPHCEDGPFCEWRDGSALYAYRGVKVPKYVLLRPDLITIEDIQKESNKEVQRIMIEKYDVSRYLMDIKGEIVDMDSLTLEGSAPRALIKDNKNNHWFIGTDGSTERVYHMLVSSNIRTCREAHESLAGFSENRLLVEC